MHRLPNFWSWEIRSKVFPGCCALIKLFERVKFALFFSFIDHLQQQQSLSKQQQQQQQRRQHQSVINESQQNVIREYCVWSYQPRVSPHLTSPHLCLSFSIFCVVSICQSGNPLPCLYTMHNCYHNINHKHTCIGIVKSALNTNSSTNIYINTYLAFVPVLLSNN